MIPLRSIPTVAIAVAALVFALWAEIATPRQDNPFAAPASAHAALHPNAHPHGR
jgi:hypothetical protein